MSQRIKRLVSAVATVALVVGAVPAEAGMSVHARLEIAKRYFRTAELSPVGSANREVNYRRAEQLAELVVVENPNSADANFLLFAARGRRLLDQTTVPSASDVWKLANLNKYLSRTLELDPRHAHALAAKGGLLLDLPSFLGGDVGAARRHLERAVQLNPTGPTTHLSLARALHKQGLSAAARKHALLAAHYACVRRTRTVLAEAEEFLAELDGDSL